MINTSTEYKKMFEKERNFTAKATCLLKDGTRLELDKSNFFSGGVVIADGVSSSNQFDIGTAIINQLTLVIDNADESFSDYNFTDAVITVWVGMQLPDRVEWLKKGVFNSSDPTTTPAVLTLKALDNMAKFDRAYDGRLTFPTTLQTIVQHCCTQCGVLLYNGQFPNYGYTIQKNPFDEKGNVTYRALIAFCALLAGCYARCNADGRLELKWYDTTAFDGIIDGGIFDKTEELYYQTGDSLDGGTFTDYNSGDNADGGTFTDVLPYHHIYSFSSLSVSTEDVVITGIRVKASDGTDGVGEKVEGETYLCGAEGYILDVSGNPLIEAGKAKEVAEYLAGRIVGMRFRPFNASCIGDPSMEAGDAAVITDRKGNSYNTYLTNITYSTGSYASISCDAEPAARHSADRYAEINKIVADIKKDSQQQLTEYGKLLEQMNGLAVNAMGYYETTVVGDDGSKIHYMHDKPLLSDSRIVYKQSIDGFFWSKDGGTTWTGGIDKDGNAVMNVIAAIGISSEWIDTRGFKAADDDGNVTFEIDANTGKVRIVAESFSLSGKSIQDIANGAVSDLDESLTFEDIFNRLTKNGEVKGLYIENGQLYISFSYAKGGELDLGGSSNVNGVMKILNSYNVQIGRWDKDGINITSGTIKGSEVITEGKGIGHSSVANYKAVLKNGTLSVYLPDVSEEACGEIYGSELISAGGSSTGKMLSMSFESPNGHSFWDRSYSKTQAAFYIGGGQVGCNKMSCTEIICTTLTCKGSKSRVIRTPSYGDRLQYCYEMPSPMFGDMGNGETDENGVCYIAIDDVFLETVTTNVEYNVFLQKEGPGDLWVSEKKTGFFVVKGTENLRFAWEIKAAQRGYEYERLERTIQEERTFDFEGEYLEEINRLIEEKEQMLYETA